MPSSVLDLRPAPPREATGHGDGGPCAQAHRRRLRLLDIPALRHRDVLGVLRELTPCSPVPPRAVRAPRSCFDLHNVQIETACLLLSSFCLWHRQSRGRAALPRLTQLALLATGLLGLAFLTLEVHEFAGLVAQGAGPSRSAFLSSFFALVGCHGAHVTAGLLWLGTMMAQFYAKGFRPDIRRRYLCFSLFWHALDIIWVAIFTIVYLIGART